MAKKLEDSATVADEVSVEKNGPQNDPNFQYVTVSLPGVPEACVMLKKDDDPEVAFIHYKRHYGIIASSHAPKLGEGDAAHANIINKPKES